MTLYEKNGQSRPYQQQDELSPPTVDSICPLPILNSHQKVIISHAGEDFIYLQKLEFSTVIAELLGKLFEFYNEKEYEEQEWKVGMYCAAKSSAYEQWYRAKISAVESDITVQYIDYGNYETLPLTSLRMLDSSFYDQHYLAFKVSFYVQWLVAVETLLEITEGNVYNAVVLRKNCFEWLAELMSQEGVSLTDSLVELGFVTALEDSPFKRVVEGGRFIEGSDLSVSVSHIDSPSQIWLLIVSDIEVIEELQDRLQVVGDRLKPLSQPSGLFAAKFSDGMWYRAVHISDNIVRFIDYGNSDQVDMSDLKELTSDFTEPAEGYAVKCELFVEPNEGEWNDYSKQKLEELLIDSEEELVAHVLAVKESSVVAELFVRGKSVSEILVEQGLAKIPQKQTTVFVCHINSPSDFFIQHKGSEAELEEIAENMLLAENFEELNDINGTLDNLIAAKYSVDELWYRAKVIEKVEDKITVLFVDYGNCAVVTDIKVLPIEIAAKPCAAKHCSFKLPSGVEYWSETATDLFEELAAGGTTSFNMVLQCQGEPDVVVLFTSDGRSIVEDLKTVCIINENDELAKPETIKNIEEEAPDSRIPVYVTHANSPDDFYIQLETSSTDLEVITDRMIDFDGFTVINSPSEWIGKLVAGKSSSDDLWYRAKVLEHNVSGTSVLFVDYGNNEVISEVRELPEDIIESAFLAKHCALKLPNGVLIWSAAACESFIEIVLDSSVLFEMDILKVGEPNVITLRFDGKQIENVLLELCDIQSGIDIQDSEKDDKIVDDLKEMSAADESPTLMESAGDFFPVFVSHYNSPNDFYIQNEGCEISLQEIASSLMGADSFNDLNTDDQEKLIGELVASQYQFDSLWYRSKILEFHSSEAKVLFVDFGNTAIVTNLKELPRGLKERRTISIQCSLNQPNEIDNWSESACSKFIELTGEGTILLELRILKKCDAVNIVDLYFEGQSVTEELTKLCMPNVNIKMTDLILDSVQHDRDVQRNQIVQEVEQITEDIINEATDRVVEKFVKLEAEALVSRIKEYEGMKSNDEKLQENDLVSDEVKFSTTVDYANTLSRYNNDEHIVPGCGYQSSELKELLETANTVTEQVTEHKTIEDIIPIVETLSETKDRINTLSNSKIDDCASQNTMIDAEDKEKMHSLNCDSENSLINTQLKTIDHTPSRYNIDEHIVPGCVLQSTMDNSEKEKIVQSTDETESNENKSIEKSTVKKLGSLSPVKNINPSEDKNSNGSKLKIVIPNVKESAQSDSKHPKTPNRLNIDEHIVPGCMTHVIPHQQSSPSDH